MNREVRRTIQEIADEYSEMLVDKIGPIRILMNQDLTFDCQIFITHYGAAPAAHRNFCICKGKDAKEYDDCAASYRLNNEIECRINDFGYPGEIFEKVRKVCVKYTDTIFISIHKGRKKTTFIFTVRFRNYCEVSCKHVIQNWC